MRSNYRQGGPAQSTVFNQWGQHRDKEQRWALLKSFNCPHLKLAKLTWIQIFKSVLLWRVTKSISVPRSTHTLIYKWVVGLCFVSHTHTPNPAHKDINRTRMWADAQRDGRPAEYRWCPQFNAATFGWCPILECHAVMLPRHETVEISWGAPNYRIDLSR